MEGIEKRHRSEQKQRRRSLEAARSRHKAPACAMSADTAPRARDDVEDDPSAEEALASLEALIAADPEGIDSEVRSTADALRAAIAEAAALAASTSSGPEIGPALPPAVSRKRARARVEFAG